MSALILFQHCLSLYHTSSMGGAPKLMRLKQQIHKNILLSPKWRLLLTSALLAQEFITIRGTMFLVVSECNLQCMFNLESNIEGPGQRSRYSSSLSAGRFGFKLQWAFSRPVKTGPEVLPASCAKGTRVCSPE
jgi:hypothetical protein